MNLPIWGVSKDTVKPTREHAFVASKLGGLKSLCGAVRAPFVTYATKPLLPCETCNFKNAAVRRQAKRRAA